ncbi:monocarboxylate transporter 13-like [Haliotis rufescens]|uniref:monocarboxylate transporter 13-like n=1 Tax=Haliotis rufescens TaxID=6454 RepID=UPI00201F27AB|nr:monocarboxylate transporter 13-like [Haliotis rufescens]
MENDYTKHKDIDKGWAWVVLVATSLGQVITGTVAFSTGYFQTEFLKQFPGSNGFISLVSSIFMSLQLTMGPASGLLCNVFGVRAAMMAGGVILSLGLFIGSFATNLLHLMVVYSLIAGAGFGITYTPLNVILGYYFHKKRVMANGIAIASCGIGFGVGAYLVAWVLESWGWRAAMASVACLTCQMCIIGCVYFPLDLKTTRLPCCRKEQKEDNEIRNRRFGQSNLWFLCHPLWWILCVNYGLQMVGLGIQLVHFPSYAESCGVPLRDMPPLGTAFGVVLSFSRLLGGCVCNDDGVDLLMFMFATQSLYGIFILFMPFYASSFTGLMVYTVLMSLFYGASFVPLTPLAVRLFGVDKLATVFGWIMLWGGLGYLIGPVIAGRIFDVSSSYTMGFHIGGILVISSAFLLLLIPILDKKLKVTDSEKRDNQQNPINEDKLITIETSMEGKSEHISS